MGFIANYQQITDEELEALQESDDLIEDIEALQEKKDLDLCDIDKMWDALHFLLTGQSATNPIEDNLISEAIMGQINLPGDGEYICATQSHRVREIAKALQKINLINCIKRFNMGDFAQNDIYPAIWENEDEANIIIDDLCDCFESLKSFYLRMAEKGCAVLVSIY